MAADVQGVVSLMFCAHVQNFSLKFSLIRSAVSAIHQFRENMLECSWNVSETPPRLHVSPGHQQPWYRPSQRVSFFLIENGIKPNSSIDHWFTNSQLCVADVQCANVERHHPGRQTRKIAGCHWASRCRQGEYDCHRTDLSGRMLNSLAVGNFN